MGTIKIKDADGNDIYLNGEGAGTAGDPFNPKQYSTIDNLNNVGVDAGGRTRVNLVTTLLDGKVVNGHTSLLFQQAGTGTHNVTDAKNAMSVTSGQFAIFQSRRFYPYFSGKTSDIEGTFDNFQPQTNVEKRLGYFSSNATTPYDSDKDGFWLYSKNSSIGLRMERNGTQKLDLDITQWSGYPNLGVYQNVATWQNFTVVYFDMLWLGGAVLRLWVKVGSSFVLAHQFDYAGTSQDTFMQFPCKPMRYEIRSSTGSGSFRYICSQISTGGSFEEDGIVRVVKTGSAPTVLPSAGTTYPILAIKKQSAFRCVASKLNDFSMFVTSNADQVEYSLQINPTLSSALTYSNVANSSLMEAKVTGTATITVTSPGTIIAAGYLTQNSILPTELLKKNFLAYLGGDIDNNMDTFVLCGTPVTGITNANVHAAMSYKEF